MVISTIISDIRNNINVSTPTCIGNMTIRSLTVMGAVANNNSQITCVAAMPNGTAMTSSAYLSTQGQSTSVWCVLIQYVD